MPPLFLVPLLRALFGQRVHLNLKRRSSRLFLVSEPRQIHCEGYNPCSISKFLMHPARLQLLQYSDEAASWHDNLKLYGGGDKAFLQ